MSHTIRSRNVHAATDQHHLLRTVPAYEEQRRQQLSISVLTPVYNERHLVAASLGRVLALTSDSISRLEVIVVDDHSTDGTWEVLQSIAATDDRVQLYRHNHNQGKG